MPGSPINNLTFFETAALCLISNFDKRLAPLNDCSGAGSVSSLRGQKPSGFLRHIQIFEVIIEKSDFDIKYLIKLPKVRGILTHLNWTCGQQDNC